MLTKPKIFAYLELAVVTLIAFLVLLSYRFPFFDWIQYGGIRIRQLTAGLLVLGAGSLLLHSVPRLKALPYSLVTSLGISIVALLSIFGFSVTYQADNPYSPSLATLLFFQVFFVSRLLAVFWKYPPPSLFVVYWFGTLVGAIAVLGHVLNVPVMYFSWSGISTGVPFLNAVCAVLLFTAASILEDEEANPRINRTLEPV